MYYLVTFADPQPLIPVPNAQPQPALSVLGVGEVRRGSGLLHLTPAYVLLPDGFWYRMTETLIVQSLALQSSIWAGTNGPPADLIRAF